MPRRRRGKSSKRWKPGEKERFMASPTGRAWVERKIVERNARRPDPGRSREYEKTKFPFIALINGKRWVVDRVLGTLVTYPEDDTKGER